MKQTKIIMGLPITVQITGSSRSMRNSIKEVFDYFKKIDRKFSTYKKESEASLIRENKIKKNAYSREMNEVINLSEQMKKSTNGFFDIYGPEGFDPSGIVKGWAIKNAAKILGKYNFKNFYINAGGDIYACGLNTKKEPWKVGITNPFKKNEIIKVLGIDGFAVATSGNYERGQHIYNPISNKKANELASITVLGPDVVKADVFATAAFAMGILAPKFIKNQKGYDCFIVQKNKTALYTEGLKRYLL